MNIPEQPTVWPPAPTLPPPEAGQRARFYLRLPLPEWLAYVLKESAPPCALLIGVTTGLDLLHHTPLRSWKDMLYVCLGIMTLNGIKFWLKIRRQRSRTRL